MSQPFRFEDFIVQSPIGQGAFGQIYKAQFVQTGEIFALKALNRRFLLKMKKQSQALIEKDALNKCAGDFIIKLFGTFKDTSNLYFVLKYAQHGDLAEAIHDLGSVNTNTTRYLTAQLLEAISHMHKNHVIHRDIKVENILLDENNHIMVTDFGTALVCEDSDPKLRESEVVGTPAFVAPELLDQKKICYASDLWAFGCTIFNLLTGKAAFEGETIAALMSNIVTLNISKDIDRLPENAKDLILKLLVVDPTQRLGYGESEQGYPSIRAHPFFHHIPWDSLNTTEMPLFSKFEEETPTSFAKELLDPSETIVLEGIMARKRYLSWKDRLVILTNHKRIVVFNIKEKFIKTIIPVNPMLKVSVDPNGSIWTLKWGENQELKLKCADGSATLWGTTILKEMTTR